MYYRKTKLQSEIEQAMIERGAFPYVMDNNVRQTAYKMFGPSGFKGMPDMTIICNNSKTIWIYTMPYKAYEENNDVYTKIFLSLGHHVYDVSTVEEAIEIYERIEGGIS